MHEPTLTPVAPEDSFLAGVFAVARPYARLFVLRDDANDIAQDVVLHCLTRLRAGGHPFDVSAHVGLVKTMVLRRLLDSRLGDDRRASRDAEHERERSGSAHVWMQPDLAIEECELERLRERTLASLPRMCRCVYTMVRDQDLSYQTVAAVLGISRSAVCHHVTMAQRRFRIALLEQGVGAPIRRTTCRPEPVACRPDQSEQPARAAA